MCGCGGGGGAEEQLFLARGVGSPRDVAEVALGPGSVLSVSVAISGVDTDVDVLDANGAILLTLSPIATVPAAGTVRTAFKKLRLRARPLFTGAADLTIRVALER